MKNGQGTARLADLADLAADGSRLRVSVAGQPSSTVEFHLPVSNPVRVKFEGNCPLPLRQALLAIGREALAGEPVSVVVGGDAGAAASIGMVPVRLSLPGVARPVELNASPAQLENVEAIAPRSWPAAGEILLRNSDGPLASLSPDGRTLWLTESIITVDSDLPRRPVFVSMVKQWCGRLVGQQSSAPVLSYERIGVDPAWTFAGQSPSGIDLLAAIDRSPQELPPVVAGRSWLPSLASALLLAALALLFVDDSLWLTGKTV